MRPRNPVGSDAPRVEYINPLNGWVAPQFIPGAPGNLPANKNRPPLRVFESGAMPMLEAPAGNVGMPSVGPQFTDAQQVEESYRYARMISGQFAAPVTQDNTQLFLTSPVGKRNILVLRNASVTANLYIDFGKFANANSPFLLQPTQTLQFDVVVPQDDLYVFADAAAGLLIFSYSTIR